MGKKKGKLNVATRIALQWILFAAGGIPQFIKSVIIDLSTQYSILSISTLHKPNPNTYDTSLDALRIERSEDSSKTQ